MKNDFINCLYITTILSLFHGFNSYGQQFEKHHDSVYVNQHVTGVGTPTVVYHLTTPLGTTILDELEIYLESMNAINDVQINGLDISIQFKENTTHEMIYLFIQRMEMLYVYRNPKTR
ncbi:hypothetical protein D3C87_00370 [compost metagenome]